MKPNGPGRCVVLGLLICGHGAALSQPSLRLLGNSRVFVSFQNASLLPSSQLDNNVLCSHCGSISQRRWLTSVLVPAFIPSILRSHLIRLDQSHSLDCIFSSFSADTRAVKSFISAAMNLVQSSLPEVQPSRVQLILSFVRGNVMFQAGLVTGISHFYPGHQAANTPVLLWLGPRF